MAVEGVINATSDTIIGNLIVEVGKLGLWIRGIGIVIILWIVFQIINLINNRVNRKRISALRDEVGKMNKKIDKLLRK
jgi:hypothetical protein